MLDVVATCTQIAEFCQATQLAQSRLRQRPVQLPGRPGDGWPRRRRGLTGWVWISCHGWLGRPHVVRADRLDEDQSERRVSSWARVRSDADR